jgi:hypothetical protein
MKCPEKAELQRKCTEAVNEYLKILPSGPEYGRKLQTEGINGIKPYLDVYRNWINASRALSQHLTTHRC